MYQLNNFLNGYRGNPDILKIPNWRHTVRLFFCACWFIYIGLLCIVACENNIITISSNVSTAHTDRCQRKTNGNFITVLMCFIISCGGRPERWNSSFSKGYFFNWHACNGDGERCLWRFASFSYSSHLWPPHALWIVILKRTTPIRTEMLDHRLKVRIYNNFILICSCSASQTVWWVTMAVNSITAGGKKSKVKLSSENRKYRWYVDLSHACKMPEQQKTAINPTHYRFQWFIFFL